MSFLCESIIVAVFVDEYCFLSLKKTKLEFTILMGRVSRLILLTRPTTRPCTFFSHEWTKHRLTWKFDSNFLNFLETTLDCFDAFRRRKNNWTHQPSHILSSDCFGKGHQQLNPTPHRLDLDRNEYTSKVRYWVIELEVKVAIAPTIPFARWQILSTLQVWPTMRLFQETWVCHRWVIG